MIVSPPTMHQRSPPQAIVAWYKGLRCIVSGWELAPALTSHIPHHRVTMGGMVACERGGSWHYSSHPARPT